MKHISIIVLFLIGFYNCEVSPNSIIKQSTKNYLYISHTRTKTNLKMDSVIEAVNYNKFDMLWIGGDLTINTSAKESTMRHVDSILDIGNKNTLWSLGNHDYANLKRVQKHTKRPPYYSYNKNGLTIVVLDTQDSLSSIVGRQKKFFNSVVDTLKTSTHLIVLHHKLIWMYGSPDLEKKANKVANAGLGDCFHCINPNNFYSDIYPKLKEVKERGIEVICIAGDLGSRVKEFEYLTPEGIHFLSSGMDAKHAINKALLFEHNVTLGHLNWSFIDTTEL